MSTFLPHGRNLIINVRVIFETLLKMRKYFFGLLVFAIVLVLCNSCMKPATAYGSLYTPTVLDTTATATLKQLQEGRNLFINNCGNCHNIPVPESYSSSDWRLVLQQMVPRTGMSSAQASLVYKYVTKGKP